jgi:hypothetical protein
MSKDESYIITVESEYSRLDWQKHFGQYKSAVYEHDPIRLSTGKYLHILRATDYSEEEAAFRQEQQDKYDQDNHAPLNDEAGI